MRYYLWYYIIHCNNSLRYIKVVFCKVFYRLFSYVYVFLYLKIILGGGRGAVQRVVARGGEGSTGSREGGRGV